MIQDDARPMRQILPLSPPIRGAVVLALAALVAYIPFHVLTEQHIDRTSPAFEFEESHNEPGDDHDHHRPHHVTAHAVHALVRSDFALHQVFVTTAAFEFVAPREIASGPYFAQRIEPSSQSPPDRIQARAPPLL